MLVPDKLTLEVLLETPTRSPAVPNHHGNLALYTVATHKLGRGTTSELRVMTLETGSSRLVTDNHAVHDAIWLDDGTNNIIYLEDGEEGSTLVKIVDADDLDLGIRPFVAGIVPAPVGGLRVKVLDRGRIAVTVVGLTGQDGELYNEKTAEKESSTGRIYDNFRVRLWNQYKKPQKYSIFYSQLGKSTSSDDQWKLESKFHNAVINNDGTLDDCPAGIYGGALSNGTASKYDLSDRGIAFITLDPETFHEPKYSLISVLFYVAIPDFTAPTTVKPRKLGPPPPIADGSAASCQQHGWFKQVTFSPDGTKIACSKMFYDDQVETHLFLLSDVDRAGDGDHAGQALDVARDITRTKWDVFPSGSFGFVTRESDITTIYFQADESGRVALYKVDLRKGAKPELLDRNGGSVAAFYHLRATDTLLVSASSMLDPSIYRLVDPRGERKTRVISSVTRNGALIGASPGQISEMYYDGDGDHPVHAFVVSPRGFDPKKKYPLALMIHGGPAYAWRDEWVTRWSLPLWGEHGYIVVAPNITGSTGYGYDHTARIHGNYGGSPYRDLVKLMEFLTSVPYIDLDNAVAVGESFGGYMINWIHGHSLGRKFKALAAIEPVFSLMTSAMEGDLPLGGPDFHGPNYPWINGGEMAKWDPSKPELLRNWTTPTLVIHNDRDYREPITQGMATFMALQMRGTPSRFLRFEDEGHFVGRRENLLVWYRVLFEWMGKYSGVIRQQN